MPPRIIGWACGVAIATALVLIFEPHFIICLLLGGGLSGLGYLIGTASEQRSIK